MLLHCEAQIGVCVWHSPVLCEQVYAWLGVEPPRGVLLHGPPGCGKTALANAIANQCGVPFLRVSAPEIVSGMSGRPSPPTHITMCLHLVPCYCALAACLPLPQPYAAFMCADPVEQGEEYPSSPMCQCVYGTHPASAHSATECL